MNSSGRFYRILRAITPGIVAVLLNTPLREAHVIFETEQDEAAVIMALNRCGSLAQPGRLMPWQDPEWPAEIPPATGQANIAINGCMQNQGSRVLSAMQWFGAVDDVVWVGDGVSKYGRFDVYFRSAHSACMAFGHIQGFGWDVVWPEEKVMEVPEQGWVTDALTVISGKDMAEQLGGFGWERREVRPQVSDPFWEGM